MDAAHDPRPGDVLEVEGRGGAYRYEVLYRHGNEIWTCVSRRMYGRWIICDPAIEEGTVNEWLQITTNERGIAIRGSALLAPGLVED